MLDTPTYDVLAILEIMSPVKYPIYQANGECIDPVHKYIDFFCPDRTPLEECHSSLFRSSNPKDNDRNKNSNQSFKLQLLRLQ